MKKLSKTLIVVSILAVLSYIFYNFYYTNNINKQSNNQPKVIIGEREVPSTDIKKGTIFISTVGTGNECTEKKPCSLEEGVKKSKAGDVVFFRGGVYDMAKINNPHKRLKLNSGTENRPIVYESYPNELAIFDGKNLKDKELGSILLRDYTHVRKIEIRNMLKVGIKIRGNHNLVEGVETHHNHYAGIHIYSKNGYKANDLGGSYNIIKDCKIHHNEDTDEKFKGGDADGISISNGMGNLVTHNRVYSNSDDGIDTWKSINTTVEYCISYNNGKKNGNGKGFKLGGDKNISSPFGKGVIARFNIAYNNKSDGYSENSGKNVLIKNNIAYNNGGYGFVAFEKQSSIVNNIAYKNHKGNLYKTKIATINNSWQLGEVKDSDFVSLDPLSKEFLKPKDDSAISSIGAYASK